MQNRLRIAVLGPGEETHGWAKRKEIRDVLQEDGAEVFFLEKDVRLDDPWVSGLDQEWDELSRATTHLIIVLVTEGAYGSVQEIADLRYPELMAKTAILFPTKYYQPTQNLVANTVQGFLVKMLYTDQQLEDCQVVGECRKWAQLMASGSWWGPAPLSF